MTIKKIYDEDIESLKVASLPSRPTAPTAFGGAGYTAKDMKSAFDRLPLFIISRLNELIELIGDPSGVIDAMPSGISDGHTLKDLTRDITSGAFATYLSVLGEPLADKILAISEEISRLELLIGRIGDNGSSDHEGAANQLTERLEDVEGSVSALLSSVEAINTEIQSIYAKISDSADEIASELTACRDLLSERIDVIEARLEGRIDLNIDCGGPGNL